jgi:hypothetical protein
MGDEEDRALLALPDLDELEAEERPNPVRPTISM